MLSQKFQGTTLSNLKNALADEQKKLTALKVQIQNVRKKIDSLKKLLADEVRVLNVYKADLSKIRNEIASINESLTAKKLAQAQIDAFKSVLIAKRTDEKTLLTKISSSQTKIRGINAQISSEIRNENVLKTKIEEGKKNEIVLKKRILEEEKKEKAIKTLKREFEEQRKKIMSTLRAVSQRGQRFSIPRMIEHSTDKDVIIAKYKQQEIEKNKEPEESSEEFTDESTSKDKLSMVDLSGVDTANTNKVGLVIAVCSVLALYFLAFKGK